MRNVSFFSCLYVLAGLFTVISSCKKEHNESREVELTSSGLSVSKAHDWFEKNKSVALNLNKPGKSGSVTNFTPDWQNALNSEDVDYYIVECPAKFSKPTGFSIKKAMGNIKTSVNGITNLLILKSKKTGSVRAVFINVHSYSGSVDNKVKYKNPGNSFNGIIFYTDLSLNFINGWEYNRGKVIAEIKKLNNSTVGRAPVPDEDCYTFQIDTYERDCYYYEDPSLNYCTHWQYVGSTTYTICSGGGGGGGGGGGVGYQTLITTNVNFEVYETSYLEEDYSSSGPVPIKYTYLADVVRIDPGRLIASVFMYPTKANPLVATYPSSYLPGVSITRSLTLFNHTNSYSLLSSTSVMLNWYCAVHGKYVYSNGEIKTRQWSNSKSAINN